MGPPPPPWPVPPCVRRGRGTPPQPPGAAARRRAVPGRAPGPARARGRLGRAARPGMTSELRAALRARLEDWQELLRSNPIEARPIFRRLLVGRLVLTPKQLPAGRVYEFTGT